MKKIHVMSFGFKYGVLGIAHFVFDVRRCRNPHKVPSLREKNGEHPDVKGHVMADPLAQESVKAIERLLRTMLPGTKGEDLETHRVGGTVIIAIGCHGGRHRSVVIASEIAERLKRLGIPITVSHREKDWWA